MHWFAKEICADNMYSCNLDNGEAIDGMVMKQYAAQALTNEEVLEL